MNRPPEKKALHPRNRHRHGYDFAQLTQRCPELARFVAMNPYRAASIDFADPEAVKALNRALLVLDYGVAAWDIPPGYLCPPIPGRADCLHHLADLLAAGNGGAIPRGGAIRVLDIGVGANCIYPLIGHHEYGWHFLGADIDPGALASAGRIVAANEGLAAAIQLRRQPCPENIFKGLLRADERFDLSICNPPFHASLAEAQAGTRRKLRQLGQARANAKTAARPPVQNFGGQGAELWCDGGEAAFVGRMIEESAGVATQVLWFSTLISKEANLPGVYRALKAAGALAQRTLDMAQGQKKSRIVAWTFLDARQQKAWRTRRWGDNSGAIA